jgi:hypothetical protein
VNLDSPTEILASVLEAAQTPRILLRREWGSLVSASGIQVPKTANILRLEFTNQKESRTLQSRCSPRKGRGLDSFYSAPNTRTFLVGQQNSSTGQV